MLEATYCLFGSLQRLSLQTNSDVHVHFVHNFDEFTLLQGYSPLGSPGIRSIKSDILTNPIVTMVAEKLGKTPAQVALRWGLQMGHSVIPKSTKEARINENFDVFDWSIPEDLFVKFSEISQASST